MLHKFVISNLLLEWIIVTIQHFTQKAADEIRSRTRQPFLSVSDTVCGSPRLSYGDLTRRPRRLLAGSSVYYQTVHLHHGPFWEDFKQRTGRPRQPGSAPWSSTCVHWNLAPRLAKRRAQNRSAWRLVVVDGTCCYTFWRTMAMARCYSFDGTSQRGRARQKFQRRTQKHANSNPIWRGVDYSLG